MALHGITLYGNGGNLSLHDFDSRFEKRDLAVGEIDRVAICRGEELAPYDRELVASILRGRVAGVAGDAGPIWVAGLGDFEVGFEEVLIFASQGDGRHFAGAGVVGE